MKTIFPTFAAADFLSFSVCMIVLFGFCAGIILLKAWVTKLSTDRDMARRAKLDQMMRANATNEAKRAACVIKEMTQTALSNEDIIMLYCSIIGNHTISTYGDDLSSRSEEPEGPSVTLNLGG